MRKKTEGAGLSGRRKPSEPPYPPRGGFYRVAGMEITFYADSVTFYADSVTFYADSITFYADSVTFYADSITFYANSVTVYAVGRSVGR